MNKNQEPLKKQNKDNLNVAIDLDLLKDKNGLERSTCFDDMDMDMMDMDMDIEEEIKAFDKKNKDSFVEVNKSVQQNIYNEIREREKIRTGEEVANHLFIDNKNANIESVEVVKGNSELEIAKELRAGLEDKNKVVNIHTYDNMSLEDREALEIGRQIIEGKNRAKKRSKWRIPVAAASVIVMTMGVGSVSMTSRFKELVVQDDRFELEQNTTIESELDLIDAQDTGEQQAYEAAKELFGMDVCWIESRWADLEFESIELVKEVKRVVVEYYGDGSAITMEILLNNNQLTGTAKLESQDQDQDLEYIEHQGVNVSIKEFSGSSDNINSYQLRFIYNNLHYMIWISNVEKVEIEKIIKSITI